MYLENFRTFQMAVAFQRACSELQLSVTIRDQLERAAVSLVCNIAEGSAKPSRKDQARFYGIALGSFRECQALLLISGNPALIEEYDGIGACLFRLSHPKAQA